MIIRTRQHRLARAADLLFTFLAWAAFAWLVLDGIQHALVRDELRPLTQLPSQLWISMRSLAYYLLVAFCVCIVLLVWAKYNQVRAGHYQRRKRIPNMSEERLADSFSVDQSLLPLLQSESRLTLYHDEHGNLDHAYIHRLESTVDVRNHGDNPTSSPT